MVKKAILALSLFLLPFMANAKTNKTEKNWEANLGIKYVSLENPNDEFKEFVDLLNRTLWLETKWPNKVFIETGIGKYFGDFFVGLNASALIPQKFKAEEEVNVVSFGGSYFTISAYIDEKFYEYNCGLEVKNNFSSKTGTIYFGTGANITHKQANLNVGFTIFHEASEDTSAYAHVKSHYAGWGYSFDVFAGSDWRIYKNFHVFADLNYCFLGECGLVKRRQEEDLYNSTVDLEDKKTYTESGSLSARLGTKIKF